jgi:hypothetical protein
LECSEKLQFWPNFNIKILLNWNSCIKIVYLLNKYQTYFLRPLKLLYNKSNLPFWIKIRKNKLNDRVLRVEDLTSKPNLDQLLHFNLLYRNLTHLQTLFNLFDQTSMKCICHDTLIGSTNFFCDFH